MLDNFIYNLSANSYLWPPFSYKRFTWNISLRFNELISIDRRSIVLLNRCTLVILMTWNSLLCRLQIEFPHNAQLKAMQRPEKFNKIMWLHDDKFLESRGKIMLKYIQVKFRFSYNYTNLFTETFFPLGIAGYPEHFTNIETITKIFESFWQFIEPW